MRDLNFEIIIAYIDVFLFFGGEYLLYTLFIWILLRKGIKITFMKREYDISKKKVRIGTVIMVVVIFIICNVIMAMI